MKNAKIFHLLGVLVLYRAQRYCYVYPWGGTRTMPQGCTTVSWLLLPCLCIPSLPWLATVLICPLKLREGHEGWSLFPTNKKWGTWKGFCAQEPHSVLLGFIVEFEREVHVNLHYKMHIFLHTCGEASKVLVLFCWHWLCFAFPLQKCACSNPQGLYPSLLSFSCLTALKWLMGHHFDSFVCLFVCFYLMPRLSLKNKWGDTFFISSSPLEVTLQRIISILFFCQWTEKCPAPTWKVISPCHMNELTASPWGQCHLSNDGNLCAFGFLPLFCNEKNEFVNDRKKLSQSPL